MPTGSAEGGGWAWDRRTPILGHDRQLRKSALCVAASGGQYGGQAAQAVRRNLEGALVLLLTHTPTCGWPGGRAGAAIWDRGAGPQATKRQSTHTWSDRRRRPLPGAGGLQHPGESHATPPAIK